LTIVDAEKKLYNCCINPKNIDACEQLSAEDIEKYAAPQNLPL